MLLQEPHALRRHEAFVGRKIAKTHTRAACGRTPVSRLGMIPSTGKDDMVAQQSCFEQQRWRAMSAATTAAQQQYKSAARREERKIRAPGGGPIARPELPVECARSGWEVCGTAGAAPQCSVAGTHMASAQHTRAHSEQRSSSRGGEHPSQIPATLDPQSPLFMASCAHNLSLYRSPVHSASLELHRYIAATASKTYTAAAALLGGLWIVTYNAHAPNCTSRLVALRAAASAAMREQYGGVGRARGGLWQRRQRRMRGQLQPRMPLRHSPARAGRGDGRR